MVFLLEPGTCSSREVDVVALEGGVDWRRVGEGEGVRSTNGEDFVFNVEGGGESLGDHGEGARGGGGVIIVVKAPIWEGAF